MGNDQLFAKKPLKVILDEMGGAHRLQRVLGPVSLTAMGVGAIIGTGIFVLVGIACIFAALCYAEFASMVPVAGSAYTYAYATLGELFAWIIGWDLVLEYAVGSATVAHGWSAHFQEFIPIFHEGIAAIPAKLPATINSAPFNYCVSVGTGCPHTGFVATGSYFDLPAILITFILTIILVKGIKESATFNAIMVAVKLVIVLMVIGIGGYIVYTRFGTTNWHPFAPYGYTGPSFFGKNVLGDHVGPGGEPLGMFAGAAIIFFAYIGFDSVSVHSEEAKNPAKDVPIGIIASLIICTLLYIAVSAVLTGMVPTKDIDINAPVVEAFKRAGLTWMQYLVAFGAMTGITSVLLVMMLSQPRVMLALARDGLVPRGFFGDIHPKFRTPWKSTILTGLFVASMAGFIPLSILAEMTSIGTLFAFVIVCGAVIVMRRTNPNANRPFRAPLVPLIPILGILTCLLLMFSLPYENWVRLIIWLVIGLIIYFLYGRRHSVMSHEAAHTRHEIKTHGVSPAGQAVGDPDAAPSSPAAPVRTKAD